jgi:3-oxoacyl-[acyl-carrier protein] reductase
MEYNIMSVLTLKGRVAFVTGAAQGIGFVTAKMMSREGMKVALCDLNAEKLISSAQEINAAGGAEAFAVPCDVSCETALEAALEAAAGHFGQLDVVVNSAGILSATKIPDIQRAEWDKILSVNLSGAFFASQKALPWLKKSAHPRIINIASVAGRMGGVGNSMSYAASKGGMVAITRGMARHLGPLGITVNAVCPGPTRTPIMDTYSDDQLRDLKSRNVLGRIGESEDVAAGICYLASEEAGYVTGITLDINGGFWMG